MKKLSKHFYRYEFACHCGCGFNTADYELILILEDLRAHFNTPTTINSGARCATHNANVGGARKSKHLVGKAADVVVQGVSARKVYLYLSNKYPNKYGVILYSNRVHVDCRPRRMRKEM